MDCTAGHLEWFPQTETVNVHNMNGFIHANRHTNLHTEFSEVIFFSVFIYRVAL